MAFLQSRSLFSLFFIGDIYPAKTMLPLLGKRTGGGAWSARF